MEGRRVLPGASPPSAVQRGFAYLVVAVLVTAAGFAGGLAWGLTVAVGAGLSAVGLSQFGRARLELVRRRRAADALLRTGVKIHPHSELLSRRAAQLTSPRNRRALARSLNRIVGELERPSLVSAVPLNRRGLRRHLPLIRLLAARLGQLERPVTAQGMLLVEELLTDGYTSPLYLGGSSRGPADRRQPLPVGTRRVTAASPSPVEKTSRATAVTENELLWEGAVDVRSRCDRDRARVFPVRLRLCCYALERV